jgi:glycosyltransferase involved in cell wall biosynthesis
LPMVPLEAMAAGVPIVASRVDGVTDLVRDGIEGVLCEPGNADDLAAAVARIIRGQSDWPAMRQRAYRRQRSEFSDRSMAAAIAELYHKVIDE